MRKLVCPAAGILLALPLTAGVAFGQAASIDVSLDCYGNPERITVTNNTPSNFTITSIQSIDDPQGTQVFRPGTNLAAGQSITYDSGSEAAVNRLTGQDIFDSENPSEGVVVMTTTGQVVVRCTQRTESVAAGQPPADAPPATPTPAPPVVVSSPLPLAPTSTPIVLPVEPDGGIGDGAGPPGPPTGPTPSIAVVGGPTPGPGEAVITGGQKGAPAPVQAPGKAGVAPAQFPGKAGAAPAQAPAQAPAVKPAAVAPAQAPAAKPAAVAPAQAPAVQVAVAPAGGITALPRTGSLPVEALALFGTFVTGAGVAVRRFLR